MLGEKHEDSGSRKDAAAAPRGPGLRRGRHPRLHRHGNPTLFAVLDITTGAVIVECGTSHRLQELLSFLRRIDREVAKELDLHMIAGNFCAHKHA